jgi:phosphoribosylamine--glycine ligase
MNILFISKELNQLPLACRLAEEGHLVKIFEVDHEWSEKIFRPLIKFVSNWKKELKWVGKSGLIVFDYTGMGKTQDDLRKAGYSVFGGCEVGDKLENNRQYGQKIFSTCGIKVKGSTDFRDIDKMISFIKEDRRQWVIKQNGHMDKGLNYVSQLKSGEDAISLLKNYKKTLKGTPVHFDLQEKIDGIEIAVGRFFNGSNWVGPICLNIEHKNLFNNELGPKTHEMGNLMWYDENENNKLYQETLFKMTNFLKSINFRGYFDINCIVNEKGAYPLEATARLGVPTTSVQNVIHLSQWGKFLKAIADGKRYNLKYRKGYAVVVFLGAPPYPYKNRSNFNSPKGLEIFFRDKISKEDMKNISFEEVSIRNKDERASYIIVSTIGYIAHVGGIGKTVREAREKTYALIDKLVVPKMFYRTDIGLKFMMGDNEKLKSLGWI